MLKNELIDIIIKSQSINNFLKKVNPEHLRDDFRQHYYLQLLEISEEKLNEVYNRCPTCLIQFAGKILVNQLKSNKSYFYRQYRLKRSETDLKTHLLTQQIPQDQMIPLVNRVNYERVLHYVNSLHPKKSVLFLEYYKNNKTLREISNQYNIKYRTVHHSIRNTEKLIKENVKYLSDEEIYRQYGTDY